VRLGISACLLGEEVRYDGGHKKDPFLTDLFGKYVEWVPVCPEVEMGLGVPRETMRLTEAGSLRLTTKGSGVDHTPRFHSWAEKRLAALGTVDGAGSTEVEEAEEEEEEKPAKEKE